MYRKIYKRLFDLFISVALLIVTSPLLLIIAICLAASNFGKVFYVQERSGKDENTFFVVKFRTMKDIKNIGNDSDPDAHRLTKIGKLLRKTSLDELPQLLNVIKGDMSLIGPRPLLVEYLPLYNEFQKQRHKVLPGITGWAQVNGRNGIVWEEKFNLDVWYVNNLSFSLDLKIIFLTILKIIKTEGISAAGFTSMPKFIGTK